MYSKRNRVVIFLRSYLLAGTSIIEDPSYQNFLHKNNKLCT